MLDFVLEIRLSESSPPSVSAPVETASASTVIASRAGLVYLQWTSHQICPVKPIYRGLRFWAVGHFNESESS